VRAIALGQRGAFGEPESFSNFAVSAQTSCTTCPLNTYSTVSAASNNSVCTAFPANTVAPGLLASDHDQLSDCVATPGFYGAPGQPAVACPAGFFKDFIGVRLSTSSDCLPCTFAPNILYSGAGATACLSCPPKSPVLKPQRPQLYQRLQEYGLGLACPSAHGVVPQSPIAIGGLVPLSAAFLLKLDSVQFDSADSVPTAGPACLAPCRRVRPLTVAQSQMRPWC
jgi:hypothetical protein